MQVDKYQINIHLDGILIFSRALLLSYRGKMFRNLQKNASKNIPISYPPSWFDGKGVAGTYPQLRSPPLLRSRSPQMRSPPPPHVRSPPLHQTRDLLSPPPPPPRKAGNQGMRSMSGQYSSYWNAALFVDILSI